MFVARKHTLTTIEDHKPIVMERVWTKFEHWIKRKKKEKERERKTDRDDYFIITMKYIVLLTNKTIIQLKIEYSYIVSLN